MIQVKCKECGKPMLIQCLTDRRKFCSRQCFQQDRARAYTVEDGGPEMSPLESICDEGFVNLTTAIIQQAKDDVMHSAPGTPMREDAEAFFLSETFYGMTNLDGYDMLCKIQDRYEEKQQKKDRYRRKKVRCIETGRVYDNPQEVATEHHIAVDAIYKACKAGTMAAWKHWEYVEV